MIAGSVSTSAVACATCGCSLNADAATGYTSEPGWKLSMEYDFINQNQLRAGTQSVSPAQVAAINDAGGSQEVERQTINRYLTLGLSYAPSADWNFRVLVPYIDRGHSTYGDSTNPLTAAEVSGSTLAGLGDVKFIASYQGLLPTHNLGLQLGVKLPTGDYGGPNAGGGGVAGRNPIAFNSGPLSRNPSPGNLVDTSLQPGNGSTDLLAGVYYFQPVSQNFDAFAVGQFQTSVIHNLDQTGQDYRPGNATTLTFGVRYEADPMIVPQLQANIIHKSRDQGALADNIDTIGNVAYLSPGVTAVVAKNLQVFAFVQIPVYSNLQGYQLFPRWTASAGLSYVF
jgi:hypothetical protein